MSPPMVPPKTGSSRWEAAWGLRSPGYEGSQLLLKAAHADGSCSPRCQSLRAVPKEGSNELHQFSAAHAQWGDISPSLAWWARPGSCWPTDHHLTQLRWPNVANPHHVPHSEGTLTAGLVLGGAQETVLSSFWCLPLAASEEQRPTWPQLLLSTAGASRLDVDRQIPPQSSWCFTFLLYMPEEVQKPLIIAASKQLPRALSKPAAAAM